MQEADGRPKVSCGNAEASPATGIFTPGCAPRKGGTLRRDWKLCSHEKRTREHSQEWLWRVAAPCFPTSAVGVTLSDIHTLAPPFSLRLLTNCARLFPPSPPLT